MAYESYIQEFIHLIHATFNDLGVLNTYCRRSVAASELNNPFGPYDTPLKIRVIRRRGRRKVPPTILICIPENIVEDYCAASESERKAVDQSLAIFIAQNYKRMVSSLSPSSDSVIYWVFDFR